MIRVTGLKPFLKAATHAEKSTKKVIRNKFRVAGDIVKRDAASRFVMYDAKSAAGYRTVVRQRGVAVEQKYRKTTGQHPEFGFLQMVKALWPAAAAKAKDVVREIEKGLDELVRMTAK